MRASRYAPWGAAYLLGECGFEGDRVEVAIDLFYIFEMRRPVPGNERPDEGADLVELLYGPGFDDLDHCFHALLPAPQSKALLSSRRSA